MQHEQQHTDRLAVAASRALQLISESAHARAQSSSAPATPQPNKLIKDDILDIFMSPDKPKSSLRLRAENSAKKFNPATVVHDQPQHITLNLGIPNKPSPDLKNLANYKPPTRRSIGPRRTSTITPRKHSTSPSKPLNKPPIEALLDDLDILDHSRSSKSRFNQPKSIKNKNPSSSNTRITTPPPEALEYSTDQKHSPIEHTQASMSEDTKPTVSDDDDNQSDDSFDANLLLLIKADTVKNEEVEDSSIVINPTRPLTRKRTGIKPKRVIPDSDEEEDNSFTSPSARPSATSKKPSAPRRSHRKSTSLRASHSKQKSWVNQIIDVDDDTESDDSIEIAPSRAIQFQKLRSQALATDSNLIVKTVPHENVKISTQNDPHRVISSKQSSSDDVEIQNRPKDNRLKSSPQPTKVNQVIKPSKAKVERATKTQDAQPKKPTPQPKKQPATKKKALAHDGLVPFAQAREEMAKDLVIELNKCVFKRKLPPIELVWSNRLNSTAGRAHLMNTTDAAGNRAVNYKVELALKVVDNPARLRNTLAHELCHIACWTIDKRLKENHGRFFKAWGQRVHAAMPDITITARHNYDISYKFKWSCNRPDCTRVYGRHSDSIKPERQRCLCGGGLIAILRRGKAVAIPPPAASSSTVPESEVELLIDLDSCGSSSETDGPSGPSSSPSKSLLNPYLSESEELDPSPFTNEYLNQLTHLDPFSLDSPYPSTTSTTTGPVPDPLVDHLLVEQFDELEVSAS